MIRSGVWFVAALAAMVCGSTALAQPARPAGGFVGSEACKDCHRSQSDWWTAYYPADQMQRPTGPLCDGCHSTNYDVKTKQVTEWNVGCEKCHGPGETHVRNPSLTNIVNPARLDHTRGVDTCIQCHSQG